MAGRWSLWLNPSEHDVDPYVAIHAVTEELQRRLGVSEGDVYVVEHKDPDGAAWHLHFVVRAGPTMPDDALNRETVRSIGKRVARELVQGARAGACAGTSPSLARRRGSAGGGAGERVDKPATADQLSVLQRGRAGRRRAVACRREPGDRAAAGHGCELVRAGSVRERGAWTDEVRRGARSCALLTRRT